MRLSHSLRRQASTIPQLSGYVLAMMLTVSFILLGTAPFNGFFCSELETSSRSAGTLICFVLFDSWTSGFRSRTR